MGRALDAQGQKNDRHLETGPEQSARNRSGILAYQNSGDDSRRDRGRCDDPVNASWLRGRHDGQEPRERPQMTDLPFPKLKKSGFFLQEEWIGRSSGKCRLSGIIADYERLDEIVRGYVFRNVPAYNTNFCFTADEENFRAGLHAVSVKTCCVSR